MATRTRDDRHNHPNKAGTGRARYLKQRAVSNSLIAGPGLFFTCPRGKEAAGVYELRDLLERVAEEISPALADGDGAGGQEQGSEDDGEGGGTDDIESQIEKELNVMRTAGSRGTGENSKPMKAAKGFESKKMDCECLGFIKFPKPHDPVKFAGHIVKQIQEGRIGYGLRFIQRITPVTMTCSAISPGEFEKMVTEVLEPHFGLRCCPLQNKGNEQPDTPPARIGLKFRIEAIIRCHDRPLNRTEVIKITGEVVNKFNADEFITAPDEDSVGHDPASMRHRVSIDDAEIVILISVYRYVAGISVVRDYDKDGKRFNLQALAETREKKMVTDS